MAELKVSHCPNCGRIYQINLRQLCTECCAVMDKQLTAVEKYMSRRPQADMEELSRETSMTVKQIQSYIRQGKISLSIYKNLHDACDTCGSPTRSGNLCVSCKTKLRSEIANMFDSEQRMKERQRQALVYKARI